MRDVHYRLIEQFCCDFDNTLIEAHTEDAPSLIADAAKTLRLGGWSVRVSTDGRHIFIKRPG